MHPEGVLLVPGDYWACTQPERPHDHFTAYDTRCEWCMVKARMAVEQGQGDALMAHTDYAGAIDGLGVPLRALLEAVTDG